MKITFIVLFLSIYSQISYSQDNTVYIQDAEQYIQQGKYATAHALLDSIVRSAGLQPALIAAMIDNILKNHYMQREFEIFYLGDNMTRDKKRNGDITAETKIFPFRYPDRLLRKVINQNPQFALAYKLLGDYYLLQLSAVRNLDFVSAETILELRDNIFTNYQKAVHLGYHDVKMNRWLGKYYSDSNQIKLARHYFQLNIDSHAEDAQTYFYLSEIYLAEKKYSQAYNFAIKALQNYSSLNLDLRYEVTHVAALSLYNLGEEARFLDYIIECIQIFPDKQEVYLDLLQYYDSKNDSKRMQKMMRQMLLNNPYDEKGYKYLERYSVKNSDYQFGDKLFEEMMVRFEHSDEAMGNIYRFKGNLLFQRGYTEEARKMWDISRSYLSKCYPDDSPLLKQIGDISQESSSR